MAERKQCVWHPFHHYTNLRIAFCYGGIPESDQKALEEDLKNSSSDIRRDIRRLFRDAPLGKHELDVQMLSHKFAGLKGGCIVEFEKVR